ESQGLCPRFVSYWRRYRCPAAALPHVIAELRAPAALCRAWLGRHRMRAHDGYRIGVARAGVDPISQVSFTRAAPRGPFFVADRAEPGKAAAVRWAGIAGSTRALARAKPERCDAPAALPHRARHAAAAGGAAV